MKIAVLARWVTRKFTGVFEVSRRFSQSIAGLGQDELVAYGIADEFLPQDLPLWKPLEVRAHPAALRGGFGYAPALRDDLIAGRPDVIHGHGIWTYASVVAHQCARRINTPYLLSPHGMLDPWAVRNSFWKKRLARFTYEERVQAGAACFHAATEREAADIRSFGRHNPICVIPYGIDLPDLVSPSQSSWGAFVPSGTKKLLYLSRFHPKKGMVPLLEAWSAARETHPALAKAWRLILAGVGDGGYEDELKAFCTSHRLPWIDVRSAKPGDESVSEEATIFFVGPQFGARKTSTFLDCDAFILPSFSEGLPMAVLDAWAHSRPVILTPNCNLPEGPVHGAAMSVLPDANNIARGLMQMFEMGDSERAEMGRKGRDLVSKKFVWSKVATEMRAVYAWMHGDGPKPSCVTTS